MRVAAAALLLVHLGAPSLCHEVGNGTEVGMTLLRNAFDLFHLHFRDSRSGLYRDHLSMAHVNQRPQDQQRNADLEHNPQENLDDGSSASTGMGLLSLAVGVELGFLTKAEALQAAKQTMASVLQIERAEGSGFLVHFFNTTTGLWLPPPRSMRRYKSIGSESEVSTVDTAELALGAYFAAAYFGDAALNATVMQLLESVDWISAVVGDGTGKASMVANRSGGFEKNVEVSPFNEYATLAALVAWQMQKHGHELRRVAPNKALMTEKFIQSWRSAYTDNPKLAMWTSKTGEIFNVLSDHSSPLPNFIPEFCYYLMGDFAEPGSVAEKLVVQSLLSDQQWFADHLAGSLQTFGGKSCGTAEAAYRWGTGAGATFSLSGQSSYRADAVANDDFLVFSPHIIAGFGFVKEKYAAGLRSSIESLANDTFGGGYYYYGAADAKTGAREHRQILWRHPACFDAPLNLIESIDFSTEVMGLAVLYGGLDASFYKRYGLRALGAYEPATFVV